MSDSSGAIIAIILIAVIGGIGYWKRCDLFPSICQPKTTVVQQSPTATRIIANTPYDIRDKHDHVVHHQPTSSNFTRISI